MPTLHWIGKNQVINHHLDVPFKVLNHKYGFSNKGETMDELNSGSLIIQGDNLEALKSLLPQFEGKVNCIYIDPPYNTGNEGWVYNDRTNSPQINKWLGKVVGKESEDLTRHDKWLCMMYPRLKLLQKLLAIDGVIFISCDDNEQANLKLILDEIFGISNFVANFIWNHRKSSQNDTDVSLSHNYTFCFAKKRSLFKLRPLSIVEKKFTNPDNDPRGPWVGDPMDAPNIRPNLEYDIVNPKTGQIFSPPKGRHWRFTKEKYEAAFLDNRIVFGKSGSSKPQLKRFRSEAEEKGTNPFTIWTELGTATDATKELMEIFDGQKVFQTPKPTSLIERILEISSNKNAIVLDSFAGSGTTAHAVLKMNRLDGGNRRFIMIETEDYAEEITAERIKRVIKGYSDIEGIEGHFNYYTLGESLFTEDENLNRLVSEQAIKEYIWYSETKMPYVEEEKNKSYLGNFNDTDFYFIDSANSLTTLDYDVLTQIVFRSANRYVIYADNCILSDSFMREKNIEFKKNPRDITRF